MRYFFRPQIALRNTDASGVLANHRRGRWTRILRRRSATYLWRSVRSVGDDNRSTLPYRKTFCVIFWYKSCVAIFVEIDKEIVVFRCSATQIFVARSPLAIFRVAIPTQPHLERPYIEARKTRFRHSVWHVSQQQILNANEKILPSCNNPLTINDLRNWAENGVFPPNRFVVAANDVDFNIDCCHSSHALHARWGSCRQSIDLCSTLPLIAQRNTDVIRTAFIKKLETRHYF